MNINSWQQASDDMKSTYGNLKAMVIFNLFKRKSYSEQESVVGRSSIILICL